MIRGRRLRLTLAAAALVGLALPGCYDIPRPQCGFRCGPSGACPEGYTCDPDDGRCHLNGSPPSLVCGTLDASVDGPVDAPVDAPIADAAVDAPPADAM